MPSIEVDLEGFKRLAKEFVEAAPTATESQLEGGWKCLGLAYLGMKTTEGREEADLLLAQGVFDWASKRYHERNIELLLEE